jgi:RNA polymerase sigma-70 factor, ECF subfamily
LEGIFAGSNLSTAQTFYMLDGEDKLIVLAVRGNSSAFGGLYDHYQPMIYRFVAAKVGRREEAEDITHQVFLSAWLNIKSYQQRGYPFSSWLYQIARNQVVDYYRAKRSDADIEAIDPEAFAVPASAQFALPTKLDMENVRRALAKLKPEYQDIIIMRFMEELSLKETAGALQKTEGAVKVMQHRAMKELKALLGDMEE